MFSLTKAYKMSPTFSSGVQSAILALSAILNMAWHCKTL